MSTAAATSIDRSLDRWSVGAGLISWAGVAVPLTSPDFRALVTPLWVACYLLYGLFFAVLALREHGRRTALAILAILVVCGLVVHVQSPDYGFSTVLLVCSAAVAAFILPLRATITLVAVQTTLLALTSEGTGGSMVDVSAALVIGGFQLFAVIMVEALSRESRAREELAAAHDALARAQTRLAESSRTAERLRISRDLHDLVGHQLTALAVNLEVAAHLADGPAKAQVELSRTIAKDLLRDVRAVVGSLREAPIDLPTALRTIGASVPSPAIHLTVPDDLPGVDLDRTEALLRCVQEIITNTVRHADSDNLWIDVSQTPSGETVIMARDDGRGSDEVHPGNGLLGMDERLRQLGGRLAYGSADGGGFRVEARLPVPA